MPRPVLDHKDAACIHVFAESKNSLSSLSSLPALQRLSFEISKPQRWEKSVALSLADSSSRAPQGLRLRLRCRSLLVWQSTGIDCGDMCIDNVIDNVIDDVILSVLLL